MKVLVYDSKYRYLYGKIEKETEKAILIEGVWFPKSQLNMKEPSIYIVSDWVVDRNIEFFFTGLSPEVRQEMVTEIENEIKISRRTSHQENLSAWMGSTI